MESKKLNEKLIAAHLEGDKCKLCPTGKGSIKHKKNLPPHVRAFHPGEYSKMQDSVQDEVDEEAQAQRTLPFVIKKSAPMDELVMYAATTTFSLAHVDNKHFRAIFRGVPNFHLPHRRQLSEMVRAKLKDSEEACRKLLDKASHGFSISADISTTKGMDRSFMAVCAHAWTEAGIKTALLDVVEMNDRHTAAYIRQVISGVMESYSRSIDDFFRIATDSGANFISAFKDDFDDASVDKSDDLCFEFDDGEDADEEGLLFVFKRQVRCVAHRLQLALHSAFKSDEEMKELKERVFATLTAIRRSHNATRKLLELCGKKILLPGQTRWSTLHITYSRVLEISTHINEVAYEFGLELISRQDLDGLGAVCELISPFRKLTEALERREVPTVSMVLPGITSLLERIRATDSLPDLRDSLIVQVERRFNDVLNSGGKESDPLWLAAAALDPQSLRFLPVDKMDAAYESIRAQAKSLSMPIAQAAGADDEGCEEITPWGIPAKRRRVEESSEQDPLRAEFNTFVKRQATEGAVQFWAQNSTRETFPLLSQLAKSLLSAPATSSEVERVFSMMTAYHSGYKGTISSDTLRSKMMVSFNENLL